MNLSELFIDKSKTLIINTELALVLGDLNESIVLNQLNYWLEINKKANKHFIDGRFWVYNSYTEWKENDFPYWSEKTIQRIFTRLVNKGIVVTANYNEMSIDRTKWYSINYTALKDIVDTYNTEQISDLDKLSSSSGQNDKPIPEITTKDYNNTSPTELNTDKSVLSPTELHTSLPGGRKADTNSKDKWVVTKKHIISVMDRLGYGEIADITQNAIEIFRYYYVMYKQKTGIPHPRLNDKTMTDTLRNFIIGTADVNDCSVELYEDLIDMHFSNNYGKEIDWSIRHFMTEDVRNMLYYRVMR